MSDIAVLMTCFNRREGTLRCLQNLFRVRLDLDVYLVDDGSTDGTSVAVENRFPAVKVIPGQGNLFWTRGMHMAWRQASAKRYRFYLWLNDDVVLTEDFLDELLSCTEITGGRAIISGIIDSHDHASIIYGAADENKKLLQPNGKMQEVINMNGNVVIVPNEVFEVLGNLDPVFHHDLGDVDYGLRARAKGIPVLTTRKVVGSCDVNDLCRVRLCRANLLQRFKRLYSPLGSPPVLNFYFRVRHYGIVNAVTYYIYIHCINLLPDNLVKIFFGRRYIRD